MMANNDDSSSSSQKSNDSQNTVTIVRIELPEKEYDRLLKLIKSANKNREKSREKARSKQKEKHPSGVSTRASSKGEYSLPVVCRYQVEAK
jgi:hypothetical protein